MTSLFCRLRRACWLALLGASAHAACPPTPAPPSAEQAATWAAQAPDRGLLWRISKGGHSSYLYGSLHVGRADWAYPGPALRAAWAATEVLAVELDPADVMPALASLPPPAPLPAPLARRLEAQFRAACLPPAAMATLPAMLQLSTLVLAEARRDGLDAAFGQDLMLLAQARAEGRPVQSLESVQEQLEALSPPAAELSQVMDSSLKQLKRGRVRGPMKKLADAWSRGDLKLLADYARWCDCADTPAERAWMARVNDDRNGPLAARITALHGAGQRLLVVVGALHMSGPQALPRLLAAEGFTVEALLPSK
jgi:uncharacterized protein YbaP (TraB family)